MALPQAQSDSIIHAGDRSVEAKAKSAHPEGIRPRASGIRRKTEVQN